MPSLDGATGWLNSPPLTTEGLRGRVVAVDFWTYTCINWLRTVPYVRAWDEAYRDAGLVVLGVHTPEFPFEQDVDNVRRAIQDRRITYPVAVDNDYGIWTAFANMYWPALYLVDAQGDIRYPPLRRGRLRGVGAGHPAAARRGGRRRRAARTGDRRGPRHRGSRRLGGPGIGGELPRRRAHRRLRLARRRGGRHPRRYTVPSRAGPDHWALAGEWTVQPDAVLLHEAGGRIAYRFSARDLHLVMAPAAAGDPVRFGVRLDGEPPGADHGDDVDDDGAGTVTEPRLYQLVRQRGPIADRTFEITFHAPGVGPSPSPSASRAMRRITAITR